MLPLDPDKLMESNINVDIDNVVRMVAFYTSTIQI